MKCRLPNLLIMKLTIGLLLLIVFALNTTCYAQTVTLKGKNLPLTQVFESINRQTGFSFFYEQQLLKNSTAITIDVNNMSLEEALKICLTGQNISYEIKYNTIILNATKNQKKSIVEDSAAFTSVVIIRGNVTDERDRPLLGTTVKIKETTFGTSTDGYGNFTLYMPLSRMVNAVLVFSSVGYTTQEINVRNNIVIAVRMVEEFSDLDRVIVVGYGTQKKRNVTGAVASYNADDIPERPLTRVDQALVGQLAGVQVNQTTGVPGKAFAIRVRGSGSISAGNEPLYVIDGFPLAQATTNASGGFVNGNPLDNMNPSDIESIQVLKDAASAAIYGSRAANGVVLITTKKGKSGKPRFHFNGYTGFSEASRKLDMMTPEDWIDRATEMINAQWVTSGPGRTASQTTEQRRQILGLGAGVVNSNLMLDDRWFQPGHPGLYYIDWQDEAFKKGLMQNYQVSASGGSEFAKYYISGNYTNQQGILVGMDYTSYSARANIEVNASDKLKFGLNIAPSYSLTNDPGVEGKSAILRMLLTFPGVQQNEPGTINVGNNGQYIWSNPDKDPISRLENTIGLTKRFRTLASIFMEYEITKGFIFKTTANLDNTDNSVKTYIPSYVSGTLLTRQSSPGLITSGSYSNYKKQTFVNENTFSYNKVFNAVHDLSLLAGASYNSDKFDNASFASSGGYSSTVITTLNAASAITGSTTETKNVLLSYFGRLQYGYDDKYLFSGSLRRDGSSRFGKNTKWGWFPSASLGWRVSKEHFFSGIGLINDLKLRASWGKSGNYNIGDYSSVPLLGTYNYTINGVEYSGQAPSGIVNFDLSWEKSATFDVGLDAAILDNRVTTSLDFYEKLNSDLLLYVPIPASTGFSTTLSNAGSVKNKGWEIELNTVNLKGDLQWSTSANLSHNTNKVVALAGGQTQIYIPSRFDISHTILKLGEPLYSINVVKQIGILTREDIAKNAALFGSESEGDPKYFDANGDGVINANDRVIVGHPSPDYTWAITNSFRYRGFDLSLLIQGQWGGSIYSLLGYSLGRTGLAANENPYGYWRDRWRSDLDPGAGKVGKASGNFGAINNTDWLYSSDYYRIRNITLGYNLTRLFKSKQAHESRVYATLENYFGHQKYTGGYNQDAANEDLSGSSIFPEAGDFGGLPIPKSLIVGFTINF